MTNPPLTSDAAPLSIRCGDRVTVSIADDQVAGEVTSLHRDVKNGCPGLHWTTDTGEDHWGYLGAVLSVNGAPTDYAERYGQPEAPVLPGQEVLERMPVLEQAGRIIAETHAFKVRLERLPVPEVFDPAEETDESDGGLVSLDVQMHFRMPVAPEALGDADVLCEAFARFLHEAFPPSAARATPGV